jgi:hypothetical protein
MPVTSRVRGGLEALADRVTQTVETVTRSSRVLVESGNVDDVNPPEDIDEFHDLYHEVGLIRGNINQFVRDVWKPGIQLTADDDTTEAYFTGGEDAPEFAPPGGFLKNCAVMAEKRMPFYPFGKVTTVQRWTRGTVLVEKTKADDEITDTDARITGFKHIRPETVSARTYANTNILLDPDDTETADEITPRGEAAAWVQFDDNSIVGRRHNGMDRTEVPLSQRDVLRQTLNPDIGGQDPEDGVFGTSIIESIAPDAREYQETKRDRARAVKTKAYGVWSAEFDTEVIELPREVIVQEWDRDDQDEWIDDVGDLGPGDIIGHDGSITLDQWEPSVPDLDDTLKHYVGDILAPLPAPKYATAFGDQVNQHVSDRQENAYHDTIQEERQYQSRSWTQAFRDVAERHPDLDPTGLRLTIEPEEETSPILSMTDDEVARLEQYASALSNLFGPGGAPSFVDEEVLMTEVLQLPEDAIADGVTPSEMAADEAVAEAVGDLESAAGAD